MKLIKREKYLNELRQVRGVPDIKVITGLRRSGKSKLMDSFIEELSTEENINIIRINMNLNEFSELKARGELYRYAEEHWLQGKENLLFVDEIQMCSGFEESINSIYEEEKFDIYITGSNAFLMSSDLATLFRGRVYEISVFPFSFAEYLEYFKEADIDSSFEKYVAAGGLSGSYLYKTKEQALSYVRGIFRTTIVRDIVEKYHVENEEQLVMLADFLMDNIGNKTSVRNIANCLPGKANDKTVGSYLSYLVRAFMFYPIQRYDIKGKKYFETDRKYYLADIALRFAELGSKTPDWGRLYENLVAVELLRRGYELYVGVLYGKEIDFVAVKNGSRLYIQVSDDISGEQTMQREIAPLLSIKDAFPKMIIARTKHETTQTEGVLIADIARWLAGETGILDAPRRKLD